MKFTFLTAILFCGLSNATTIECADGRVPGGTTYTIVTGAQNAVVTRSFPYASDVVEPSYFGTSNAVNRTANGVYQFTIDKATKVKWKEQSHCWANAGARFVFDMAGENSSLEIQPRVVVKPNVICRQPDLLRSRIQLSCKQLQ